MRLAGRFGALQERPFRLLWLGQTASAVGDALIPLAFAFAVIDIGGGPSELGLVLSAFTLSRVAFIVAGGVWADRLPRRIVMLVCDVVRGLIDAFTAVALLTGAMEIWMFVVTASLFGAATAFFGPAATGLVPETISRERLQQANALLRLSETGTNIFGPALSGLIVAVAGAGWVFAIDAASFVVSAAFLAVLPLAKHARPARQRFLADLREGWHEAWSRGWLRAGYFGAAGANIGIAVFFVLGPIVAEDELGGAAAWGAVLTGGAVGGVLGGAAAYRLQPTRPLVACFAVWSLGSLPLLALAPPLPALALAVANGAFIFGITFGNTIYETVLQREIPPESLSRVSSYDWMISLIFMPLGQALAGPAAATIGIEATLVAAAVLLASSCAAGILVPSVRRMRYEPQEPKPAPAPASSSAAGE